MASRLVNNLQRQLQNSQPLHTHQTCWILLGHKSIWCVLIDSLWYQSTPLKALKNIANIGHICAGALLFQEHQVHNQQGAHSHLAISVCSTSRSCSMKKNLKWSRSIPNKNSACLVGLVLHSTTLLNDVGWFWFWSAKRPSIWRPIYPFKAHDNHVLMTTSCRSLGRSSPVRLGKLPLPRANESSTSAANLHQALAAHNPSPPVIGLLYRFCKRKCDKNSSPRLKHPKVALLKKNSGQRWAKHLPNFSWSSTRGSLCGSRSYGDQNQKD